MHATFVTLWLRVVQPKNLKFHIFCVFFKYKMIKNLIFNKTKNDSVCFFIYMSSMCVQRFTAFEEAVLKLYVGLPW